MTYEPYHLYKELPHVQFSNEDIKRAQSIRSKEDKIPGKQYRDKSKWRFVGKLGEWAIARSFPNFVPEGTDYETDQFDFTHHFTQERIEVKTISNFFDLYPKMLLYSYAEQLDRKEFDLLVLVHYQRKTGLAVVAGWLPRFDAYHLATKHLTGEEVLSNTDKRIFTCDGDAYTWEANELRHPRELKNKMSVSA